MQSRISVEVDHDNNRKPCILITTDEKQLGEKDVRDSLVTDFIQLLGHESTLCRITYGGEFSGRTRWKISPIEPEEMLNAVNAMKDYIEKKAANKAA